MQHAFSSLIAVLLLVQSSPASYQTANFVVYAASPEVAKAVAESAENYRRDLAKVWLERELPDWPSPCQISVSLDAGRTEGRTDISFSRGQVVTHRVELKGTM